MNKFKNEFPMYPELDAICGMCGERYGEHKGGFTASCPVYGPKLPTYRHYRFEYGPTVFEDIAITKNRKANECIDKLLK